MEWARLSVIRCQCDEGTELEVESRAVINLFDVTRYQESPEKWKKWDSKDLTMVEFDDGLLMTINCNFNTFDKIFQSYLEKQKLGIVYITLKAN